MSTQRRNIQNPNTHTHTDSHMETQISGPQCFVFSIKIFLQWFGFNFPRHIVPPWRSRWASDYTISANNIDRSSCTSPSFLPSCFQIILHSMHKYQPRVHVIRKDFSSELSPNKPVPSGEGVKTFSFPETVFTTVTAYQNQQVRCSYFITSLENRVNRSPHKICNPAITGMNANSNKSPQNVHHFANFFLKSLQLFLQKHWGWIGGGMFVNFTSHHGFLCKHDQIQKYFYKHFYKPKSNKYRASISTKFSYNYTGDGIVSLDLVLRGRASQIDHH